ncbi:MAG: YdcF family protein [Nitrospiraceae bacterium]
MPLTISFIYAGSLLVVEVPPQRADIGLVLAGHFGRALYAADLYHQGFIPRIWISRPEREKSLVQLDSIGVPYPRQEEISRAVLLKKGVPDDRIEVIGEDVVSTLAEARIVSRLLDTRPEISSLLLITSRFHVRRAEAVFRRVLQPHSEVDIIAVGTPYDGFVEDHWWKDRDSARQVFLEMAKLLLFWTNTEY